MHPGVTAAATGECPICGMALVKTGTVVRDTAPSGAGVMTDGNEVVAAAQLLAGAASGMAPNLIGYYPSPVRQHVLRYEIYAPAWAETETAAAVLVYRDQLPTLEPAERAAFLPTADTGHERSVHLAPGAPQPWDRSLSLVHFDLDAGAPALSPGTVGWVRFSRRPRQMQVIPAAAVLQSSEGPYALVVSRAEGSLSKRPLEIGRIVTGLAAVISGLALREQVVSVNAFFWDAERRLDQRGPASDPR
jgi:Heavy metal binding domain